MTSSKNRSVHHLCESTDYTRSFEVRGYKAEPLPGPVETFTPAMSSDQDLDRVLGFIRESPSLGITNRVVDFGWRFADPAQNQALPSLFVPLSGSRDSFLWWRGGRGLLIAWDDFDPEHGKHTMGIGVLACELNDMSGLLMDVRHLAAKQRKASIFWLAPVQTHVELALQQAGYSSDWENTAVLFEKKHPGSILK
jgi:hypothetical protein